jgi:hypothetical protein
MEVLRNMPVPTAAEFGTDESPLTERSIRLSCSRVLYHLQFSHSRPRGFCFFGTARHTLETQ